MLIFKARFCCDFDKFFSVSMEEYPSSSPLKCFGVPQGSIWGPLLFFSICCLLDQYSKTTFPFKVMLMTAKYCFPFHLDVSASLQTLFNFLYDLKDRLVNPGLFDPERKYDYNCLKIVPLTRS